MQCLQCNKEFQAIRATAKFCSIKCKLAYHRSVSNLSVSPKVSVSKLDNDTLSDTLSDTLKVSVPKDDKVSVPLSVPDINKVSVPSVPELSVPVAITETPKSEQPNLSKLTAKELYMGIDSYPHNTWVDSVEYKELIRRLETLSIKQLRDQGFNVPVWKLNGFKKKPTLTV